eukprot:gb/GEZN01006385.1/.p1 GENE.gb/GEZN01006385.1/~~gb/GEZN01006385.1/.p1  ORF type:complete len:508 (-),score=40.46 gb/GEZN01006385.1/:146-1546(-)
MAGVIFGWSALNIMFEEEGVYHYLCDAGTAVSDVCSAQQLRLSALYTIGAFVNTCGSILMGCFLDRYGPLAASVVGHAQGIIACVMLAFSSRSFDLYFPGVFMLCLAGPAVHLSHFHVSALFPESQSLITSLFAGTFGCSSLTFPVFLALYRQGVSLKSLFLGFGGVLLVFLLICAFTSPSVPFDRLEFLPTSFETVVASTEQDEPWDESLEVKSPDEMTDAYQFSKTSLLYQERVGSEGNGDEQGDVEIFYWFCPEETTLKESPFGVQLCSGPFFFLVFFLSIHTLRGAFYLGSVALQLNRMTGEDSATYLTIFFVLYPFCAVFAVPTGMLLDSYDPHKTAVLINCMGILWSCTGLLDFLPLQPVTFLLFSITNNFVYAYLFSVTARVFGFATYGSMLGVLTLCAAILSLLNYTAVDLSLNTFGSFRPVNLFLLILVVLLTLSHIRYMRRLTKNHTSGILNSVAT